MFEWDEKKREAVLRQRGIDFLDAAEIFASDHLVLEARSEIEERRIAVGDLNGVSIAVVFTMRNAAIRIITARRARRDEREKYHAHVTRRDAQSEKPD